jgi:hypothetical protein
VGYTEKVEEFKWVLWRRAVVRSVWGRMSPELKNKE